jgi:type I restriction enzyme R subunit
VGTPQQKVSLLPTAQEHILKQTDGKSRLLTAVTELSQAFALAVPNEEALRVRDEVGFYQAIRAVLAKSALDTRKTQEEMNLAIQQIISRAVASDEVVDIFAARGQEARSIYPFRGIPSRSERHAAPQPGRRTAPEAPIGGDQERALRNAVQSRKFSEMLEAAIRKYQNRAIERPR